MFSFPQVCWVRLRYGRESTRFCRRRLSEVIENLALHAFDFGSIPTRNERQLLGSTTRTQPCQEIDEVRNPLSGDFQFLVSRYHG